MLEPKVDLYTVAITLQLYWQWITLLAGYVLIYN